MKLQQLSLNNFRNYQNFEVSFAANLVLILGANASGKTNLMESIYFLSRLRSFRAPDEFLINHTQDYFAILGQVASLQLETVVQKSGLVKRSFKINGQKTKRSLWRSFATVLFVPNDLNLFILGPLFRRKFLDEILTQQDSVYALNLASLEHVLKQRSALLQLLSHGEGDKTELEFWNQELAQASLPIWAKRRQLMGFLNQRFSAVNQELTEFGHDYQIEYITTDKFGGAPEFLAELNRLEPAEIRSVKNLLGPHRDDFLIKKNGELNIYNSSRGELRAQILALKLLQAEYLTDGDNRPIILLDDVFSELDELRRQKLLETLKGHQIFITSTEEHHLPKLAKETQVLNIENNQITFFRAGGI